MSAARSVNFGFLASHDAVLVAYAAEAESVFREHPRLCVTNLRTLAEALAKHAAAYSGVYVGEREELGLVLGRLRDRGVVDAQIAAIFRALREAGNEAVHAATPGRPARATTHGDALRLLRLARELAVWFHKSFGTNRDFKAGPFVPPPDPKAEDSGVREELERLRAEVVRLSEVHASVAEQARLRADAEARAAAAYADVEAAMSLAEEVSARLATEKAAFEARLAAVQASAAAAPPAVAEAVVQAARLAGAAVDLDEASTRTLIDAQLREAGWEADSQVLRYARGSRPVSGRNLAIAEWPTASGPADYALFVGFVLVGVVEAKKRSVDVMATLDQARRYARGVKLDGAAVLPGGPWGEDRVPFIFSTNGRAFLRQLRTRSGVWFRDLRRPQNPAVPLVGWKTPQGLLDALEGDVDAANASLKAEPTDYLGLRAYQIKAIQAVERAIEAGDRDLLVAMATGTGKTRTCVGLVYRLVKARRFRRVLFLVDRTSLGEQAADAFEDAKLENFQSFSDIYEVKRLGDVEPDAQTRLHFATVQGMVRRLTAADAGERPLPVDTYDCVIVDESHRGYHLDREMSEVELGFRSESDYISQYRRVLDSFDAVRIGLTATPALHTVEIFGEPVYVYSYREAVVDGFLVDHEPPYVIETRLSREKITFAKDSEAPVYNTRTGQMSLFRLPDIVRFGVEDFNKEVITEGWNQAVVSILVEQIDPFSPGKTLIFAVDNAHADLVVDLLRRAYRERYEGAFIDDLVRKITGTVDRPLQAIRAFRNEEVPNIAVTVDLLTTGVDVPKIVNLVFLRRVYSRILFDQMRGRATRLCPEIGKEVFRIYDAVGLFAALKGFTDMKPVVENPRFPFAKLVEELSSAPTDEARRLVLEQIIAKLQRKKGSLTGERLDQFGHLAGGSPAALLTTLKGATPADAMAWFAAHPGLADWLDEKVFDDRWLLVSDAEDEGAPLTQDFGAASADDYLDRFRTFLKEHGNDLPALTVVMTRPRELTRKQLRDLKLALDAAGYGEKALAAAWAQKTNCEVAASIIGFIRQQALGDPLLPYRERVDRALARVLASRAWSRPQREWLERIGAQLRVEHVVDRDALDGGAFGTYGGYKRIDRVFDGQLAAVLGELHDAVWEEAG
jgi:type I restriction enzyme R subunit